jgi:hypothetical protein
LPFGSGEDAATRGDVVVVGVAVEEVVIIVEVTEKVADGVCAADEHPAMVRLTARAVATASPA